MKLLALDTSSGQCSVALSMQGNLLTRAVLTPRDHAQLLLPMVDELLAEAGTSLRALDGIAFGRGPGSFTGVRIAAAVTQGLAEGAGIAVLPVSSLRALAAQARRRAREIALLEEGGWLACMDARMGEVYWGLFPPSLAEASEAVGPPEALQLHGERVAAAAGKGLAAFPRIAVSLQLPATSVFAQAEPHALDVAQLALGDLATGATWLDPGLAQPTYLRDSVAQVPRGA
jgi:tRNA threonylcarbamoyladenosine biosynthesis protein TsaB